MKYRTLYGYYGGKSKLQKVICQTLRKVPNWRELEYREPMHGGGSVQINFLRPGMACWLNDADRGVACVWSAVMRYPAELCALVERLPQNDTDVFEDCRSVLPFAPDPLKATRSELVETAVAKLYVQRHAFNGLSVRGACMNRRKNDKQNRWIQRDIAYLIRHHHERFGKLHCRYRACTAFDYSDLIKEDGEAFFYCDPPYVSAQCGYYVDFNPYHHVVLAGLLRAEDRPWLLSYDNDEWVKITYAGFRQVRIATSYDNLIGRKRNAEELLIANFLPS